MRGGASGAWAWRLCMAMGLAALVASDASAQASITTLNTPLPTQDFNSLTDTNGVLLPTGWAFAETGSQSDGKYGIDDGATNVGNPYSYGTTGAADRAFGTLLTGNLKPTIGASFKNNSLNTITSIQIAYVGEQWRVGQSNTTADRLVFGMSTNATSLSSGTWTAQTSLDFTSPRLNTAAGKVDGNLALNQKTVSFEVTGLSIAPGATFWIRWTDSDLSGSDDGLAIDNFVLTPKGPAPALAVTKTSDAPPPAFYVPGEEVYYEITVTHTNASTAAATGVLITDELPTPLEFVAATAGTFNDQTRTWTYNAGTLALGQTIDVLVTAKVPETWLTAGTVHNNAKLTATNLNGTIEALADIAIIACTSASDCDDGNVCTTETCDGQGSCHIDNNTASCADSNLCNGDEVCGGGTCHSGTQKNCDDSSPCTLDSCKIDSGECEHSADPSSEGVSCSDGDACTNGDQCVSGSCMPGPDLDCGTGDPCNVGTCNQASGCQYTTPTCDDQSPCTVDQCVPFAGCINTGTGTAACNDGNGCTSNDTCDGAGHCVGAGGCNDNNPCTVDNCGPGDICNFDTIDVGAACDDHDPCTEVTSCQANGACGGGSPTTAACDDHDNCTENDKCGNFVCAGTTKSCNDNEPCTDDACVAGSCVNTPNTAPCDDGTVCNGHEVCANGSCGTGTALACDDNEVCTTDSCDPVTGCKHDNNTLTCDDHLLTTHTDTCGGGACHGTTIVCPAVTTCQTATPNGVDCTITNKAPGSSCDDGNANTSGDQCNSSGVCAGTVTLAQWTFETSKPVATGTTISNITPEVGANPPSSAGGRHASSTNWRSSTGNPGSGNGSAIPFAADNWAINDYFEFKTSTTGYDNITFGWDQRRSAAGPTTWDIAVSTDGTSFTVVRDDYTIGEDSWNATTRNNTSVRTTGVIASLANQASVWIRVIAQAAGAGTTRIDNVTITGVSNTPPTPKLTLGKTATPSANPLLAGGTVTYQMSIAHDAASTADASSVVLTDTLPAHTTATGTITVSAPGVASSLTLAAGDDAGEVVDGVLTVRLGTYARGGAAATVSVTVTAGEVATATTLSNSATVSYNGSSGAITPVQSNTTTTLLATCGSDLACADADPCTNDTCTGGNCAHSANTGASCDDHNTCNGDADTCDNGQCKGTVTLDCNDHEVCTDDSCDAVEGCKHDNNTAACEDGDACTSGDHCVLGACVTGPNVTNCDDANDCTIDSCDVSGCLHAPSGATVCDDHDACTTGDACGGPSGMTCGGTPTSCDDGDLCTTDACDPIAGCTHTPTVPAQCNDGNECTTDTCSANACHNDNNTAPCDDHSACTSGDTCAGGHCGGAAVVCNDGKVCTDDSCDPVAGCQVTNNTAPCDDGLTTTHTDTCGGGACHGTTIVCPAVTQCQEAIPNGVSCPVTNKAFGTGCDDANAGTIGDQCDGGGVCAGRAPSTIAQWTFETNYTAPPPNQPDVTNIAPEIGTMPPSVGGGHHAGAATDYTRPGGNPGSAFAANTWAAGDYFEFKTSTTGYDAISVRWDSWRNTNASATFAMLLSTDGVTFSQVGATFTPGDGTWVTSSRALADASDKAEIIVRLVAQVGFTGNGANSNVRIDNVTFTGAAIAVPAPKLAVTKTATPSATPLFAGGTVAYGISIAHHAASTADAANVVLTDTLPAHSTATGDITVSAPGLPATLTAAAGDDAGEIVGNVVTVRLGAFAKGAAALTVGVTVTADSVATATTLSNTATVAYDGPNGAITPASSNTTATLIVTCGSDAACADDDPCTDDACTGGNCVNAPNTGNACDDDDVCNGTDACSAGHCVGTATLDCGDGNVCTDDLCDPVAGCSNPDNTAPCSDGDPCTSGDACLDGECMTGPNVTSCDDGNACTTDSCDASGCVHAPSGATTCDDHNACTTGDVCGGADNTTCAGAVVSCDDNDFCTDDSCNVATGCAHVAAALPSGCNDDNPCTTDSCSNNACVNTPNANPCEADDNPCTDDVCAAGACAHPANTAACDDDDACTTNDRCANKACGGRALSCDDGKACTSDSCDPDTGCVFAPKNSGSCDDGNPCSVGDSCQAGACVAGGGVLGCNDNNPCTADSCSPSQGCVHDPIAAACNDNSTATSNDQCKAGVCSGTPITCSAGTCQLPGTPNGVDCPPIFAAPGVTCDDGQIATSGDHCDGGGTCVGSQIVCPPEDVCARYEPNGAGCKVVEKTGSCDDGFVTTRDDKCVAGVCEGTAYTCTPTQCEVRSVPNGTGCVVTNKALGIKCDDGALSTWDDRCDGGGACVGKPYTCEAVGACVVSSAPDGKGGCTTVKAAVGTDCDDLDPCTVQDACDAAGACVGEAAVCGEGELCGPDGSCELTHCRECAADAECGLATGCVDVAGVGGRCLLACDSDAQCATGQVCRADAAGTKRCWDDSGECAAPAGPGDEGPDTVEVVEAPDEVEAVEETDVVEAAEPDVTEDDAAEDDTPDASDTSGDVEVIDTVDDTADTAADTGPGDTEEPGPEESEPGPEVTEVADTTADTTADTGEPNIERVELAPDSGAEEGSTIAEGGGCASSGGGAAGGLAAAGVLVMLGLRARKRRSWR